MAYIFVDRNYDLPMKNDVLLWPSGFVGALQLTHGQMCQSLGWSSMRFS
jgi:hypothetical protein